MANYTIEQVDYLREKADVSYEEAVSLLEQYQGDLTRCLIDLERNGRIRKGQSSGKGSNWNSNTNWNGNWDGGRQGKWNQGPYNQAGGYQGKWDQGPYDPANGKEYKKPFVLDGKTVRSYLFSRIKVTKGDMIIANLPVVYLIVALFMAPHLFFLSVLAMFVLGYRIKWELKDKKQDTEKDREVYEFVDKAARNIKRTASSFASAVKQEVYGDKPQQETPPQEAQVPQNAPDADYAGDDESENDTDPSDMTIE